MVIAKSRISGIKIAVIATKRATLLPYRSRPDGNPFRILGRALHANSGAV